MSIVSSLRSAVHIPLLWFRSRLLSGIISKLKKYKRTQLRHYLDSHFSEFDKIRKSVSQASCMTAGTGGTELNVALSGIITATAAILETNCRSLFLRHPVNLREIKECSRNAKPNRHSTHNRSSEIQID